ncbi:hydroxyacid dehydrogenase [Solemya pervernicosa gill symbiont]|uniref:Hydroxyacid dehydrogenase n=1 Tax=Solemya pervernicosa gill symbiont TaxID=642797 RepID=A0A1T2LB08_9GAMM|nr:NAD(P)-dependent oxidoreductase [Solemya pervernicosa gill symbiont]OOZ42277.1 hydroxyacid dehydrogenase [Solemya pervernicosa gill symbiont]
MHIAFIGTGLMGNRMAKRLIESGHHLIAYNRTAERTTPLKEAGAEVAATAADAISSAEVVITMLTDAEAIESMLLNQDTHTALSGKTIIQMATIAPQQSRDLQAAIEAAGGRYLESPVLGSLPEAEAGTLILMVGATPEQFKQWQPLLTILGSNPRLIGPVGHAAAIKLAMNQLIASLTAAFSLSLGFVQREGLNIDSFMEIVRESALYAPTFDKKLDKMLSRNFSNPNFPVQHLLKDVDLFLDEANQIGLNTSILEGVRPLIEQALNSSNEAEDYSALYKSVNPLH